MNFQQLLDQHLAVRILAAIMFASLYGFGLACYAFTFLYSTNSHILGTVIFNGIINLAIFLTAIFAPHTSTYAVAFVVFFHGFHFVYSAQFSHTFTG